MEDGKRIENLSWRLWNRETFCCAPRCPTPSAPCAVPTSRRSAADPNIPLPDLSSSLDSVSSDEDLDDRASSIPRLRRQDLQRNDSVLSRGREKHITPADLENIVKSIRDTPVVAPLDNLSLPTPPAEPVQPAPRPPELSPNSSDQTAQPSASATPNPSSSRVTLLESSASTVGSSVTDNSKTSPSQSFGSGDTQNTEMSTHSIVRGFVPGGAPSSYRSQTNLAAQPTPILESSPQYKPPKEKGPMLTIGTSSGEDESHMYKSSLSERLKQRSGNSSDSSGGSKKHASFADEVAVQEAADSAVFESDDDEDEGVSESAIEDDDDSSDWEDSDDQSGPSSVTEKDMFQRVDSRPNLTSRRSLLTSLMHEPDPHQLALSPRTTRRNMLSTELTESLRKNLLWERQHRSTGNLAALKRRHTSNDVRNLRQHPEPGPVLSHQNPTRFTNDYFHADLQEYHSKGW